MAYSKALTARVTGAVAAKFPGIPALTLDAVVDEALLEAERISAARGDSMDEVAEASGTATPNPDAQRDRDKARQDEAFEAIKAQARGDRQ